MDKAICMVTEKHVKRVDALPLLDVYFREIVD